MEKVALDNNHFKKTEEYNLVEKKNWYVIYVRSRCEKKVHELLQIKDIQSSLPLIKTIRKWTT